MSYLSRLKQLAGDEIFTHSPRPELTELTEAPSGGFGSAVSGAYGNTSANASLAAISQKVDADTTAEFDQEWFDERAGILEHDAGFSRQKAERRAYLEVTQ